jgi:hypothetical protein
VLVFICELYLLDISGTVVDNVVAEPRHVAPEFELAGVMDDDEKQIIDCLEHVSFISIDLKLRRCCRNL